MTSPNALLPAGLAVRSARPLSGGTAHPVWRCTLDDGRDVVVKAAADAPDGLFATEAAGLRTLAGAGLRTPGVIAVGPSAIVLEALEPTLPDRAAYWEAAGRAVAAFHLAEPGDKFGWDADGWLGTFPQRNGWDDDGHRFYAEKRLLRYLSEPRVEEALDAADRAGVERLCARLPELVPDTGSALTHGDLWRNNLLATHDGGPAFVDPAVSRTWPEVDVSMILGCGGVPDTFFAAYAEVRPLHPEWREHARILFLRELLALLAFFGPNPGYVAGVREVVARFA